jgi:hypothetical protein
MAPPLIALAVAADSELEDILVFLDILFYYVLRYVIKVTCLI